MGHSRSLQTCTWRVLNSTCLAGLCRPGDHSSSGPSLLCGTFTCSADWLIRKPCRQSTALRSLSSRRQGLGPQRGPQRGWAVVARDQYSKPRLELQRFRVCLAAAMKTLQGDSGQGCTHPPVWSQKYLFCLRGNSAVTLLHQSALCGFHQF